jgi:hypothetical protein
MTKVEQLRCARVKGESRRRSSPPLTPNASGSNARSPATSPHLEPRRRRRRAARPRSAVRAVSALVAASSAALEALREITRVFLPGAWWSRAGTAFVPGSARDQRAPELHESADRRFDPGGTAYFCVAEAAQSLGAPLLVDVRSRWSTRAARRGRSTGCWRSRIRDRVEAAVGIALRSLDGSTALEGSPAAASDPRVDSNRRASPGAGIAMTRAGSPGPCSRPPLSCSLCRPPSSCVADAIAQRRPGPERLPDHHRARPRWLIGALIARAIPATGWAGCSASGRWARPSAWRRRIRHGRASRAAAPDRMIEPTVVLSHSLGRVAPPSSVQRS